MRYSYGEGSVDDANRQSRYGGDGGDVHDRGGDGDGDACARRRIYLYRRMQRVMRSLRRRRRRGRAGCGRIAVVGRDSAEVAAARGIAGADIVEVGIAAVTCSGRMMAWAVLAAEVRWEAGRMDSVGFGLPSLLAL